MLSRAPRPGRGQSGYSDNDFLLSYGDRRSLSPNALQLTRGGQNTTLDAPKGYAAAVGCSRC